MFPSPNAPSFAEPTSVGVGTSVPPGAAEAHGAVPQGTNRSSCQCAGGSHVHRMPRPKTSLRLRAGIDHVTFATALPGDKGRSGSPEQTSASCLGLRLFPPALQATRGSRPGGFAEGSRTRVPLRWLQTTGPDNSNTLSRQKGVSGRYFCPKGET